LFPRSLTLALALRELVLTEAPEAEEVLYSVYAKVIVFRFPCRKRGAFCNVAAYSRHIRIDSQDDLRHSYLSDYIRSAIELVEAANAG
jgi:hypothetical protein